MAIGSGLMQVGTIDIVSPHSRERAHITGHPRHESSHQCGNSQAEQPWPAVPRQHQWQYFVVAVLAGCQIRSIGNQVHWQDCQTQQSGQDDNERDRHLEIRADDRRHFRRTYIFGGKHALNNEKVGRPISHGLDRAQAKHNADPVNAHGIVSERSHRRPHVSEILAGKILMDSCHHASPSTGFNHAEDRNQQRAKPDQEKLQDFVENRRKQTARRDVNPHRQGGDPDTEIDVPSQHNFHDHGHGVHIHARHHDGHYCESYCAQAARL